MFLIAVCDDCPAESELILSLLRDYKSARPGLGVIARSFSSGEELLAALESEPNFELILMDIIMPEMDGIKLAKKLRKHYRDIPVVFLTSSPDYSLEAFGVWAVSYLLKPVTGELLFPVLDKVSESIEAYLKSEASCFVISTPEGIVKVPMSTIVYVENVKRAPHFFLENGSVVSAKCMRNSFTAYLEPLLKDKRFVSPHSSFVINLGHVLELTKVSFSMKNGVHVPIPRYRYVEMKSEYFSYLSKHGVVGGIL